MYDRCIYDPFDQCFHNCRHCPQYQPREEQEEIYSDDMESEAYD
ncbi:MAG: hypothetical protein ACI4JF_06350 [Oscillospiraceae bacterium]